MRHGSANRRPRNRNHGGQNNGNRRGTHNRNQIFDSNGPDVRIRGTAHQVCEKYLALAKDAQATGDVIQAENYLQHAEHYQRIINSWGDDVQSQPRQSEAYAPQPDMVQEDDLSLPASILGGEVKLEDERTVDADAREDMLEAV